MEGVLPKLGRGHDVGEKGQGSSTAYPVPSSSPTRQRPRAPILGSNGPLRAAQRPSLWQEHTETTSFCHSMLQLPWALRQWRLPSALGRDLGGLALPVACGPDIQVHREAQEPPAGSRAPLQTPDSKCPGLFQQSAFQLA